ncbi:MAG: aminotransferase DegT [Candidatus Levybacteria bacterium RIFCSPHIGHO2_01_FULL_38_12]|nr:MAG: aminotransferase DegT [Candidatus Levybacteria bacterium RIFCSPHIGHO2_01_FULL_38_12]
MINIAQPSLGQEEIQAVEKVLLSGMLAQGKVVKSFESAFAKQHGCKFGVATSSGTTALHTALLALNLGRGDEVITTPFSFIASSSSILHVGAKPVFVDIKEDDFCLDPALIESKITKSTKAILVVHLYGQMCNMDKILFIAKKHNLLVIEDACQAHGATYMGKKAGSIGDIGCFSFYPTKNMTTGEGGIIITNSKRIAYRARLLINHGQEKRYFSEIIGYNYRMTNIAAAIGNVQLKKLNSANEKRRKNASYLSRKLSNVIGIIVPKELPEREHVYNQYTIRVTRHYPLDREELIKKMTKSGLGYGIYYPLLIPNQKPYKKIGYKGKYPVSERVSAEVLSIPVHPALSENDLDKIVDVLKNSHRQKG